MDEKNLEKIENTPKKGKKMTKNNQNESKLPILGEKERWKPPGVVGSNKGVSDES